MDVERLIRSIGFEETGACPASCLVVRPEVRAMCAADTCRSYGRNWCCPPACGSLEDYRALIAGKTTCYLAQTVVNLEDEFDVETMLEAAREHGKRFDFLRDRLQDAFGCACSEPIQEAALNSEGVNDPAAEKDLLILASGACTLCDACTCPDAPCRFPAKRLVSMEAAGLVVSEVCLAAGIPYNHGKNTIAYTGCVLV